MGQALILKHLDKLATADFSFGLRIHDPVELIHEIPDELQRDHFDPHLFTKKIDT
jgi:hypothetical protein